jgi:hypothetical protein
MIYLNDSGERYPISGIIQMLYDHIQDINCRAKVWQCLEIYENIDPILKDIFMEQSKLLQEKMKYLEQILNKRK